MDYLKPYHRNCNIEELNKIQQERAEWIERKSASHYKETLANLPEIKPSQIILDQSEVIIGKKEDLTDETEKQLVESLKTFIPWRKGPFNLFGKLIDSEWRSDKKWDRLKDTVGSLENKTVLDIGCNNGYFMFRMMQDNPKLVLGIDPVLHVKAQFDLMQHFAKIPNLHMELLGIEHLPLFENFFDVIFSMGIIYHHRNPIQQLLEIKNSLKKNGTLILETIGIPGEESVALFPEDRYAKMRNVWFVPTLSCFVNWVKRAKFKEVEVIADSPLTDEEQRLTKWCPPPHQSLNDFLDPENKERTIEGFPAPRRFAVIAKK